MFNESRFVAAMLRYSASRAWAQSQLRLIPATVAQSILDNCKAELFDVANMVRESGREGSVCVPLVKRLRDTFALFNKEAVALVYFGSSSQDVAGSALAPVTCDTLQFTEAEVKKSHRRAVHSGHATRC